MIGIVMAGGRGLRMSCGEKLLLRYKRPLVMHVIEAMHDSACLQRTIAAVSPNSPETRKYLIQNGTEIVETAGLGYVKDLSCILRYIDDDVLICPGDLPLLDGDIIKSIVAGYNPNVTWTGLVITKEFSESLGLSTGFSVTVGCTDCIYTGISLVNARYIGDGMPVPEHHTILDDKRIALNLNTRRDLELLGTS